MVGSERDIKQGIDALWELLGDSLTSSGRQRWRRSRGRLIERREMQRAEFMEFLTRAAPMPSAVPGSGWFDRVWLDCPELLAESMRRPDLVQVCRAIRQGCIEVRTLLDALGEFGDVNAVPAPTDGLARRLTESGQLWIEIGLATRFERRSAATNALSIETELSDWLLALAELDPHTTGFAPAAALKALILLIPDCCLADARIVLDPIAVRRREWLESVDALLEFEGIDAWHLMPSTDGGRYGLGQIANPNAWSSTRVLVSTRNWVATVNASRAFALGDQLEVWAQGMRNRYVQTSRLTALHASLVLALLAADADLDAPGEEPPDADPPEETRADRARLAIKREIARMRLQRQIAEEANLHRLLEPLIQTAPALRSLRHARGEFQFFSLMICKAYFSQVRTPRVRSAAEQVVLDAEGHLRTLLTTLCSDCPVRPKGTSSTTPGEYFFGQRGGEQDSYALRLLKRVEHPRAPRLEELRDLKQLKLASRCWERYAQLAERFETPPSSPTPASGSGGANTASLLEVAQVLGQDIRARAGRLEIFTHLLAGIYEPLAQVASRPDRRFIAPVLPQVERWGGQEAMDYIQRLMEQVVHRWLISEG